MLQCPEWTVPIYNYRLHHARYGWSCTEFSDQLGTFVRSLRRLIRCLIFHVSDRWIHTRFEQHANNPKVRLNVIASKLDDAEQEGRPIVIGWRVDMLAQLQHDPHDSLVPLDACPAQRSN